jgi:RNA polymerase sigma factor (sigma-70 family)
VGRDSGVAELTPRLQHRDVEDGPTDHQLVAAVRRGDDRAFERLYHRYHRRIQAYVFGMCKDHARAEDITQEIFVSALRRMRETERPIAFKPWIYEIAKNACIDQHRRARRAEEVSLQSEDGLAPHDYGRLINGDPTPDVAVTVKQDLDNLCGAFGGLSETHHEILVMRELEGLSYREIGDRLGMSRPAVESTLFRARRRLTEEYGELVSGARCVRIQGIIATASSSRLGARDTTRLSRHIAHCQPCRREAVAAGLDAAVLRKPLRRRAAAKVAAWLPLPLFGRRFARGADDAATTVSSSWMAHLPTVSDQLGAGWAKAAAAVVVLLAGVGAGVGTRVATDSGHRATHGAARTQDQGAPRGGGGAATPAALVTGAGTARVRDAGRRVAAGGRRTAGAAGRTAAGGTGAGTPASAPHNSAPAAGGGSTTAPATTAPAVSKPVIRKPKAPVDTGTGSAPTVSIPASAPSTPTEIVDNTTQAVNDTTQAAGDAVTDTVNNAVDGAGQTVDSAADAVGGAAGGTNPLPKTQDAVTGAVGSAITG